MNTVRHRDEPASLELSVPHKTGGIVGITMTSPTTTRSLTWQRLQEAAGAMATAAVQQMETRHSWYRDLSADERSWVGMVAQAGIGGFIEWYRADDASAAAAVGVFGTAPRELARSISLSHTLDLIRTSVSVVEQYVPQIAAGTDPADEIALREAVLVFSREIAFAAATVYAQAAEARGAWDARLEAHVIDAVLRAEADEALRSRVAALGWDEVHGVLVAVGRAPAGAHSGIVDALRRDARRSGIESLVSVQGRSLIAILGGVTDGPADVAGLTTHWAQGPIVVGPTVPHVFAAGRSARAALSGHAAAAAWPGAPRVCLADELLAERALHGDAMARRALVDRVVRPLRDREVLRETAVAFLSQPSLEATARALFVHANTVRYRLAQFAEVTGYDIADPREGFVVRIAMAYAAWDER